jgi:LacI family transcriptional regulator
MSSMKKIILNIETSTAYGRGFLHGIKMYTISKGSWFLYMTHGGMQKGVPALTDWGADGAIVRESKKYFNEILSLNIPTAVCLYKSKTVDADIVVATDAAEICGLAAEHFLKRKYENYAFSGQTLNYWGKDRRDCFCQAIADAGFKTDVYEYSPSTDKVTWSKSQTRMIQWLKSLPKPVAIMAEYDPHGLYVLECCRAAELSVPGDVAVIGVDNDELFCKFSTPSLSSVNLDTVSAGYHAAESLDKLMSGKKIASKTIFTRASHVVARASTDMVATKDTLVGRAIEYIRNHCREEIQVGDVADAVFLSRSALDRRFHKALGKSVQKEIRCIRVEQIARMLIETDLTVTQIALDMNFTCIEHIGRYFKNEMGVPPLEYRKKNKIVEFQENALTRING